MLLLVLEVLLQKTLKTTAWYSATVQNLSIGYVVALKGLFLIQKPRLSVLVEDSIY